MQRREHMFSLLNKQLVWEIGSPTVEFCVISFRVLLPVVFEGTASSTYVIDRTAFTRGKKTVNGLRIAHL
jgi:hypothetical protein